MLGEQAGAAGNGCFGEWRLSGTAGNRYRNHGSDIFLVNHAGTEDPSLRAGDINHGRFDADLRLSAVHDQPNAFAEQTLNVECVGR